ncbi:hypothetical protein HGM15179_013766 [Zosterops borbonicus]|uniref:Corticotropin-releasing factor domain-containing protein n=1 Tax=Zosterops borbonicus TaxID=364589 RepID=A0A8K1G7G0_9PASS|nr:hypothetical protein HGM15179_013766 [Zosterops borbonicus]
MRRALLTLLLLLLLLLSAARRTDGTDGTDGTDSTGGSINSISSIGSIGSVPAPGARHRPLWPPLVPPSPGPWRGRRDEPPLSIDLTFHLLRHLLLLARAQSQRARADSNRRILDAVGR